jgi:hypothetical protein
MYALIMCVSACANGKARGENAMRETGIANEVSIFLRQIGRMLDRGLRLSISGFSIFSTDPRKIVPLVLACVHLLRGGLAALRAV